MVCQKGVNMRKIALSLVPFLVLAIMPGTAGFGEEEAMPKRPLLFTVD